MSLKEAYWERGGPSKREPGEFNAFLPADIPPNFWRDADLAQIDADTMSQKVGKNITRANPGLSHVVFVSAGYMDDGPKTETRTGVATGGHFRAESDYELRAMVKRGMESLFRHEKMADRKLGRNSRWVVLWALFCVVVKDWRSFWPFGE